METNDSTTMDVGNDANRLLEAELNNFVKNFKNGKTVFLEDSVLWYCLEMGIKKYLTMSINDRINFKQSYYDFLACF